MEYKSIGFAEKTRQIEIKNQKKSGAKSHSQNHICPSCPNPDGSEETGITTPSLLFSER